MPSGRIRQRRGGALRTGQVKPSAKRVVPSVPGPLALQRHLMFGVGELGQCLVTSSPGGPDDDQCRPNSPLVQAAGNTTDLVHRPADHWLCARDRVFGGVVKLSALWRTTASRAKASITNETCRCQPCQLRLSLWSSPNSLLAVSNASSMAHRLPSTATRVSIPVPLGHQVVKSVQSASRMFRRTSSPRVHKPRPAGAPTSSVKIRQLQIGPVI